MVLVPPQNVPLFPQRDEHIQEALSAGRSVERYGREWIVGRTTLHSGVLSGRIGFRGAEGMAEVWDEDQQDFREIAVPAGLTAPFALNMRTLVMALQPRGTEIKLHGLIGAVRSLLSRDGDSWRIEQRYKAMSLSEWQQTVDKVTYVRFRLKKPNPHWAGAPDLEAVMENAAAEVAALELKSAEGIQTDSPFIQQSQTHVDRGYGVGLYGGVRHAGTPDESESVYNTRLGAEEDFVDVPTGQDGEVSTNDLMETLADSQGKDDT